VHVCVCVCGVAKIKEKSESATYFEFEENRTPETVSSDGIERLGSTMSSTASERNITILPSSPALAITCPEWFHPNLFYCI
jgi:hypothetical protein